jgi:SAM-dependent methyltransferase
MQRKFSKDMLAVTTMRSGELLRLLQKVPILGPLTARAALRIRKLRFTGSRDYWEQRYAEGKDSGPGSHGQLAAFKAEVLNGFVRSRDIRSVIEFGCGDGNQLALADYPAYTGLDVSKTAIAQCTERFGHDRTKHFLLYDPRSFADTRPSLRAELALSLDVIYHLVENETYEQYLVHLFSAAERFVIIYSSDTDENPSLQAPHVKHRRFSARVEKNLSAWTMVEKIPNRFPFQDDDTGGSFADFFIYQRRAPLQSLP